ncbi:MAG: SWIM zinc finger family protein [Gammaproteobacteria bacterium]|nr:SWIM zinc finger family protein [Gammaproteobacteria bacterium]
MTMNQITFYVKDGDNEPYKVTFSKKSNIVEVSCSCPAASYGLHCKHRLNLLMGSKKDIIDGDLEYIAEFVDWISNLEIQTVP